MKKVFTNITCSENVVGKDCYPKKHSINSKACRRKTAFTLAEVLITLGIIGVVASMTMPTLIQKHRKTMTETALKKFYSTINQAILLSVNENGETSYWEFDTSSIEAIETFYNKYLKKYIKTINKTGIWTNANGKQYFQLYFADGSGCNLSYGGHDWWYCINGKDLSVESAITSGTKCFLFGFYPAYSNKSASYTEKNYKKNGVEPYLNGTKIKVGTDENGEPIMEFPTEENLYQGQYWAKIIQINGWRIPDDYPLKF